METISVGEYAERRGISVQAVYKKLKSPQFKPYIQKTSDGKTRLDIAILDDTKINLNSTKHSTKHSTVEQPFNQPFKQPISQDVSEDSLNLDSTVEQPFKRSETASESDLVAHLEEEVKFLRTQIERLTDSLQFEQKKNAELSSKLQLLQAPDPQPEQNPDPPKERFIDKVKTWWNSTYHID